MKHLFLLGSLIVISMSSCKSRSSTAASTEPKATAQPTVYKGVKNDSCAVEVSFGSYGSGIDGKAYEALVAKIDEKKLKYTTKNIGREGEVRFCLPLTELKEKEKKEFIEQLKKIAAGGELVSVSIR